ncbi:MAG TPA: 3-hydroxyacyl-CoA dehydrogenase NAD-binding domain-containing protein [Stellaceae bacterium]|jgi:carnitine 3-dehydrogenase|nr:3-hydroxyacyl-CoA dehydrogenase NAD-binding domain-containing protein [Stellaceae bacterium]
MTKAITRVAVIGVGTIGASWAAYFLSRGLAVTASDPAPDAESFLQSYIANAWPALERLGGMAASAGAGRLVFERDPLKAAAGAEFVQENGPEREELKIALFAALDAVLPPETVIASSSSGFLISKLQSRCRRPERCVLGHPFNPPHLIPLVEVVGGARTAPEAVARTLAFYRAIGKQPIHIRKEVPGHVANRLQAALWREAVHLVATGVADVADIDAAITAGPGLRWPIFGPHLTFHLAGGSGGIAHFMSHLLAPMQSWWNDLGNPEMTPEVQRRIIDGVAAEAAGRSIADLAAERDRCLVALLETLRSAKGR